jgi:hypothetical protein
VITQLLDQVPVLAFFVLFAIASLVAYEVGFRSGRWWQRRTPDRTEEGPTGVFVGSLLALLAFMLAVTMTMASDRFDGRRALVLEEANAIETTYLRAGYLPEPARDEIQTLLREYVPLRINTFHRSGLVANLMRSEEIHKELWAIAEDVARSTDQGDLVSLFLESLNDTINLHSTRVAALIYGRVPENVVLLLFVGSVLTIGIVGYSAGLTGRRSTLTAVALFIALGAVTTLIVDLDRPRDGFIQVSQQPLIDLQQRLGPP